MNTTISNIILFCLLFLASCASRTPQEEAKYNNDEATRIMYESYGTLR